MSGQPTTRTGRSQISGDIIRNRVVDLVSEHRETVLAMEQAIVERAERQRAYVARLEKLVSALDYELSRGGQDEHIRAQACRRLMAAHKGERAG